MMFFNKIAILRVSALFAGLILIQMGIRAQTTGGNGIFSVTTLGQNLPAGSQSNGFQLTGIAAGKATGIWIDDLHNGHALIFDIATGQWSPLPSRGTSSGALATDGTYYVGYEVLPGVVPGLPPQSHCAVWAPNASGIQEQVDPLNTFLGRSLTFFAQSWCTSIDNGNVGGTAYDQIDLQLRPEDALKEITQYENGFLSFASPIATTALGDPVCCSILRASRNGQQAGQISFVPPVFSSISPIVDTNVGNVLDSSPAKNTFVHAAFWNGSVSAVDLHPAAGFTASTALAIDGARQGGWVSPEGTTTEAALWSGTAASLQLLAAPGFNNTRVTGICSKYIVGDGWAGGPPNAAGATRHGLLWNPDGSSVIDLNQFLPAGYVHLTINGVDPDGNIVGYAQQSDSSGAPAIVFEIGVILAPNPGASIASVTLDPSSIVIGGTATATVTLKAPAIAGGVLVRFTSGNTNWIPTPAPILVPEGQLSATFSVPTNGNAFFPGTVDLAGNITPGSAGVSIVAFTTYTSATGTLTITSQTPADPISSLTSTPTSLTDGGAATGVVILSAPAPAGGVNVAFSSSAPSLLGAVPNLLIPAGQTTGSFSIASRPNAFNPFVNPSAKIELDAATGSVMRSVTLTGARVPIASLAVAPSTLAPGATGTATATLAAPAPAGGASVFFQASDGTKLSIGGSLLIPAGQISGSIPVTALPNSFCCTNLPKTTTLAAAVTGTDTQRVTVTIEPVLQISNLSFEDSFGRPSNAPLTGGTTALFGIDFNFATTGPGTTVTLTSTNPAIVVPSSVLVFGAGGTFSASVLRVPTATTGVLTASINGSSASTTVTVNPSPQPAIQSVTIPFVSSGQMFTGTVTLTGGALVGGATISLTSSSPSIASVPATVTIPADGTSATFSGTAGSVSGPVSVVIAANFNGASVSGTLSVLPGPVLSIPGFTLSPYMTIGPGVSTTATVTINQPAPAGGVMIALSASDSKPARFPNSITVPQGQTSASFAVQGNSVSSITSTTLIATYQGPLAPLGPVSASTVVTVAPSDRLSVTSAQWSSSSGVLTVTATSTNAQAVLTVLNANGNLPLGTMTNLGGGKYSFQTVIGSISSVNLKSSLGGSTGQGVSVIP